MTNPCHHFVQNAWKKDFCSNCFKSKEEHVIVATPPRLIEWNAAKPLTSILKSGPKKKSKLRVKFTKDISQVIGYGGDYSDSDDFKEEIIEKLESVDYPTDDVETLELLNITKENTEFNTINANLLGEKKEVKKTFTALELGKPQTDAEGRKQTLLVSVMPFGTPDKKSATDSKKQSIVSKRSEIEIESKTNIVLTSFIKNNVPIVEENTDSKHNGVNNNNSIEKTLLDEIDETLEKGKMIVEKEIILVPLKNSESNGKDSANESHDITSSTDDINSVELRITSPTTESKRISLSRTVPIKKDQIKPVILQSNNCNNCNEPSECTDSNNLYDDVTVDNYDNVSSDLDECTTGESSDSFDSLSTLSPNSYDEEIIDSKQPFSLETEDEEHISDKDTQESKLSEHSDTYEEVYMNGSVVTISNTEVKLQNDKNAEYEKKERLAENLAGLPLIMPKQTFVTESRSDAGEPDGRADSDVVVEPPALPLTPPPVLDARASFLHSINMVSKPVIPEKPKVASKPHFSNKRPQAFLPQQQQIIMQLHQTLGIHPPEPAGWQVSNAKKPEIENVPDGSCIQSAASEKTNLTKQDSNASDVTRTPNKRRAPKPPSSPTEEYGGALYTRNPTASLKSDSPVVREKEKRERASSCSPKFRSGVNINPTGTDVNVRTDDMPEPAPRRLLSLSQDCLSEKTVEKKKSRIKFSIKRFLRFSTKDHDKKVLHPQPVLKSKEETGPLLPQPKQRLVIIHPLELNGSGVEVVAPEISIVRRASHDNISISNSSSSGSEMSSVQSLRPLPPPRNTSPNEWRLGKPSRPPPPKSAELLKQQKQRNWINHARSPTDNLYANLGAIRSGLAPRKPERTASMREREAQLELPRRRANMDIDKDEDTAINNLEACTYDEPNNEINSSHSAQGVMYKNIQALRRDSKVETYDMNNDSYENQSERDCENRSTTTGSQTGRNGTGRYIRNTYNQRRSDGNIDYSADYLKFQGAFVRTSSMPYCGSETESEIYSPYSFCDSEEGENLDADDEWMTSGRSSKTVNRLRMRKGRSIVHKNLEDNYGAVIVANHEALAQVVEQVNQTPTIQPALRGLKAAINLRWNDFTIVEGPRAVVAGRRAFHLALWGQHHVTLIVTTEQVGLVSPTIGSLGLSPITEFSDLIPSNYLPLMPTTHPNLIQATISVLPRMHVDTLPSLSGILRERINQPGGDEMLRESSFILLQLINGLKILQSQGIEEAPLSLSTFIFCREPERDAQARLYVLQGLGEETLRVDDKEPSGSLCQCALIALKEYLPATKLTSTLSELLQRERAISLSLVKSLLEFALWGPSDVALGVPMRDRELAIQRWLDLERATVLHGLVRARVQLSVFEESHLLFLVRSSAKMMSEASLLLDSVFLSKNE